MGTGTKKNGMPLLWPILGALTLGALLAKWAWVLFAPHTISVAASPEYGATAESGRLFGVAPSPAAATPVPRLTGSSILPNVRLTGVFAATTGRSGFAVLKLEGNRQIGVAAGQDVQPGVRLLEIHPDYVLLGQNGVQQRVILEENREILNKPGAVTYSASTATNQANAVRYPATAETNPSIVKPVAPERVIPRSKLRPWQD